MDTKALRQKILDLAIRGKLVPQDPNDEPASVLLERIREQKLQMVKDGKLKKKDIKNDTIIFVGEDNLHYEKFTDGTVKCIEEEIPFELPEGWDWTRLPLISLDIFAGGDKPTIFSKEPSKTCSIPIYSNGIENNGLYGYTNISRVSDPSITISARGTIGFCCVRETPFVPIVRLITVTPVNGINLYYLKAVFESLIETGEGSSIPQLTVPGIKPKLIPVPPVNEQNRIQNKIASLLEYIESIIINKQDLTMLVYHAKSKILDLAIRGQLVPQNPDDEPASVLLERIRAEKEELINQGKIKRDKKESVIFRGEDNSYYIRQGAHIESIDDQFIFTLPNNWEWCSLFNVAKTELGKTLDGAKNTGKNHHYLRSVNVRWNEVDLTDLKEMRFEPEEIERYTVRYNDLLICEGGDVGRSCVWTNTQEILYQNALHRVRFYADCNPFYFMYYMMYYESRGIIKALCKGVTIKHLTGNVLSLIPFALPPLAEQNRIVEKLNQVFTLLDSIICD